MRYLKVKSINDEIYKNIKSVCGFSLLEALVAFAILAVLLIPLIRLVPDYYKMSNRSNDRSFSVGLAQDKIEEFKSKKILINLAVTLFLLNIPIIHSMASLQLSSRDWSGRFAGLTSAGISSMPVNLLMPSKPGRIFGCRGSPASTA